MSLLGVTVALNRMTRNRTSAKILVTGFLNPLGLLIFGYVSSYWRIEYTTPGQTCEQTAFSFSQMTFGSSSLMMLLNKLSLTPPYMISLALPIAIRSFFLRWFQKAHSLTIGRGPTETRSQVSFDISIALVRVAHRGQLEKLTSFTRFLLGVNSALLEEFVEVFVGSIFNFAGGIL